MLSMKFALVLLMVLPAFSLRVARFYDDEVDKGDAFIDELLEDMLHEHGHEYDPYKLEDSVIGFSKKIAFVNISGEAKLHNGHIIGLKSIHRSDHCKVQEDDNKLNVEADLGAGVLDFYYDGTVKFMNWGPTIHVYGQLAYLETRMEFTVDAKTGKDGTLNQFEIDDMKGMKVWITGLGPLNWAVNYLISGVTTVFKGYIRNTLEKQIRNHIAERLPNYRFPVDDSVEVTETTAPETPAPETAAPETPTPETAAPETPAPETAAPETPAPETAAPETPAPETAPPETLAPETAAPETPAPETAAPETPAPETAAPETPAPETAAPETPAPETAAPETL